MHANLPANRRINFWELIAQVVLVFLRLRSLSHTNFVVHLKQECDNSASVGSIAKNLSCRPPMCYGLMALAYHCSQAGASVSVSHIQGKKNVVANGISRGVPEVINQLPANSEIVDFSLCQVLDPVWDFADAEE